VQPGNGSTNNYKLVKYNKCSTKNSLKIVVPPQKMLSNWWTDQIQ
jgi:hypothetical protein